MIEAIKRFFSERIDGQAKPETGSEEQRMRLATAALLIETARADHSENDVEFVTLERALERTFSLSTEQTQELVRLAAEEVEASTSHYQFTSLINASFTLEQKVYVIELMWQVAYADGHLDKYEEYLVRRISELIYVPHRDFVAAKHRVMERMGIAPDR